MDNFFLPKPKKIGFCLLFWLIPFITPAQDFQSYTFQVDTVSLYSDSLDTSRIALLGIHPAIPDGQTLHGFQDLEAPSDPPIIVVFDGNYMFHPACDFVITQVIHGQIPPSYVLGVGQINRGKELMGSQHGDFKSYLFDELLPEVRAKTSSEGPVIMVGHSMGSDFLNHCLDRSDEFTGLISLSTYIRDEKEKEFCDELMNSDVQDYALFTGTEDNKTRKASSLKVDSLLSAQGYEHRFRNIPEEGHMGCAFPGLREGLEYTLRSYFEFSEEEKQELRSLETDKIQGYLREVSHQRDSIYRMEFKPGQYQLQSLILAFNGQGMADKSLEILKWYKERSLLPMERCMSYFLTGHSYETNQDLEKALVAYQNSVEHIPNGVKAKGIKGKMLQVKEKLEAKKGGKEE